MNSIGDKTIGPFLLVAFRIRYKEVLIKAHNLTLAVAPKYLTLLTNEEAKCKFVEPVNDACVYYISNFFTDLRSSQ